MVLKIQRISAVPASAAMTGPPGRMTRFEIESGPKSLVQSGSPLAGSRAKAAPAASLKYRTPSTTTGVTCVMTWSLSISTDQASSSRPAFVVSIWSIAA